MEAKRYVIRRGGSPTSYFQEWVKGSAGVVLVDVKVTDTHGFVEEGLGAYAQPNFCAKLEDAFFFATEKEAHLYLSIMPPNLQSLCSVESVALHLT